MMTSRLQTICDFTRFAMSEMERCGICLGHGSVDLWQESTFLVLRTLHLPFDRLESFWNARVTEEEAKTLLENIRKRCDEKVPTAYILKEAWLAGHDFYCDERTLIPRSYIAECLENGLAPWVADPESVTDVLDLCTGGGSLVILASEAFPNAALTASDLSDDALEVARINLERYGLEDRIELLHGDLFEPLKERCFDLILSNPPYVTQAAVQAFPEEYRKEPSIALGSGIDGLDCVARMLPELSEHLTDDGVAVIEIGDGRAAFEARWPTLEVTWLETSDEADVVFLVTRNALVQSGF